MSKRMSPELKKKKKPELMPAACCRLPQISSGSVAVEKATSFGFDWVAGQGKACVGVSQLPPCPRGTHKI